MKIEVDAYNLQRMLMLLDAADEALTAAADLEKRNEAGKPLRSITAQERAKATRRFVAKMAAKYNVSVD
jgi:hypothetical protein